LITFKPSLRTVHLKVFTPDLWVTVNRVRGDGEDSSLGEVLAQNLQTTFRDDAGEANTRCRMNSKTFVNTSFKIREAFDLLRGGNKFILCSELFVKFLVKLVLDLTISSKVIQDGGSRA